MNKYDDNLLLPKISNEMHIQYNGFNARVYFWQELYKKYPENYWCRVFGDRMKSASKKEIKEMLKESFILEEMFYNAVVNKINVDSKESVDLMWAFIKHLEFFHEFNEFFYDVFMEFCERGMDLDKYMPDIQSKIENEPIFLKQSHLFGLVSKDYLNVIYNVLRANKDTVLRNRDSI